MSDVVQVACRSCGARMSGVRTELGSLVVPGRRKCPRCGATEFVEAMSEEAPAGTDPRAAPECAVESGNDPGATDVDSETRE